MGKPNTSGQTKPESGVLPGTPAGAPAKGPGIVPGTPDEKREQGKDQTRRRP
jgi:hypothetical protein